MIFLYAVIILLLAVPVSFGMLFVLVFLIMLTGRIIDWVLEKLRRKP